MVRLCVPLIQITKFGGDALCGCSQDASGYHQLNCKLHADRAFLAGHNVIQDALAREYRRLDLKVVDNDRGLCKN